MKSTFFKAERLPIQLVITLVVLVIVTALAIGIPALWLVQRDLYLPAAEIARAQREMTTHIAINILVVIVFISLVGLLLARQISKPLERLRDAADGLRKGDLATPIVVPSRVREVTQVANALEAARSNLQYSLQQLRQEKAWGDHLLEAVVEGILTIDRRGRVSFFSQGAERITGWAARQALGKTLDELFPAPEESPLFSQQIPAEGRRQKIVVRLAGGREATLSVTLASLAPPGAARGSQVLVLRDVSDEESIRRLLGVFLANIAHEFRTPLSALAASIELLLDQLPDLTQEELMELLGSVHLGVINLQTLIDNLLEGASIETGRFQVRPRPVLPYEIIQQAVQTMQPLADKYDQEIRVEGLHPLPAVCVDPRRTVQVLVNLLSNAIKWGPGGGHIQLTAIEEGSKVILSVTDEGPGLPDDRSPEIFLRFDRLPASGTRRETGAGLGLSVVKAIVEAQGGQVGARNRPEGGAVFWFSMPLSPEPVGPNEAAL